MRTLTKKELKQASGGWVQLAVSAARLGLAVYRHSKTANAATWAARGAGIAGTTYQLAGVLDPNKD